MIYCVEDDENIRELLVYTLVNTGFAARGFADGKDFFTALEKTDEKPELVLLDIMLPGEDGLSILKKIKNIPVILLTAKGTEYDKVMGLDAGADDYITKPFGMMELVARIKTVLRRTKTAEKDETFSLGNVTMSLNSHSVLVNNNPVEITVKEFELLHVLMQNAGFVLSRDHLLEKIWGYEHGAETRTVDVHIRTLRQKIENGGAPSGMIETVRGIGYRIRKPAGGNKT
ncbi:MAG: response regulator transcription factor [Treponema sp.]|nr:response regulator transcription factor [Treponema sp.]